MLTYINVTVENNQYRGGIEINSVANTENIGDVTSVKIWRKTEGETSWNELHTIEVSSVDDLNFGLFDILSVSGKKYSYGIDVMADNTIVESGLFDDIECDFQGLFIGNFDRQYVAGTNFKVDTTRNTSVEYVVTLSGRTPHSVSNANTNYSSGSASGLFLKLSDDKKKFVPDYDHSYSNEVLDFLTDYSYKILKTHDGQIWYVSIDANPSSPFNEHYTGMNQVQFNWTEVGDLPAFGMVVD